MLEVEVLIDRRLFLLLVSLVVLGLGSIPTGLLRRPVVRFLIIWSVVVLDEIRLLITITFLLLENAFVEK